MDLIIVPFFLAHHIILLLVPRPTKTKLSNLLRHNNIKADGA